MSQVHKKKNSSHFSNRPNMYGIFHTSMRFASSIHKTSIHLKYTCFYLFFYFGVSSLA